SGWSGDTTGPSAMPPQPLTVPMPRAPTSTVSRRSGVAGSRIWASLPATRMMSIGPTTAESMASSIASRPRVKRRSARDIDDSGMLAQPAEQGLGHRQRRPLLRQRFAAGYQRDPARVARRQWGGGRGQQLRPAEGVAGQQPQAVRRRRAGPALVANLQAQASAVHLQQAPGALAGIEHGGVAAALDEDTIVGGRIVGGGRGGGGEHGRQQDQQIGRAHV